jgi:hypothetical protein
MTPEQYEQSKGLIESRYSRAGIAAEQNADGQILFRKAYSAAQLAVDSQAKLKQARGIHVASAEDDVITEGDLKAAAEAAKKRIEEGHKWISDLDDLPNMSIGDKAEFVAKYHWKYGSADPREVRRLQEEGIANAQPPIDRYNSFLRKKSERERLRGRRSALESSAAAEAGEAAGFDASFVDELNGVRHRKAMGDVGSAVDTAQAIRHGDPVSADARAQLQGTASKIAGHNMNLDQSTQMMMFAAQSIGNFETTVDRLANALSGIGASFDRLNKRIDIMQSHIQSTVNP